MRFIALFVASAALVAAAPVSWPIAFDLTALTISLD